jgi:hypothetical protein
MRLTQRAMDRYEAYGVRASSVLDTLQTSEALSFFGRPWMAVLNPETGIGRSQERAEGICGSLAAPEDVARRLQLARG